MQSEGTYSMTSDAADRRRWGRWAGGSGSGKSSGDSFRSTGTGTDTERRKKGGGGLLGVVKKGVGAVWEKVIADHPEPLPVDRVSRVVCGHDS